jgi:hypothetical protein
VQVHCDEGVATHIGPKPCAGLREDVGEASAGERTGQPWSCERLILPDADVVRLTEGNTGGAAAPSSLRGRRPGHVRTLLAREPGDLLVGHTLCKAEGPRREGEEP